MEDKELLFMNDDEMEKTFVSPTSEASKATSKKSTKTAFVKANKKSPTDKTNAISPEWDPTVINGLMNNETIVKALHELEKPDKEIVQPTANQNNNNDIANNVVKGKAEN